MKLLKSKNFKFLTIVLSAAVMVGVYHNSAMAAPEAEDKQNKKAEKSIINTGDSTLAVDNYGIDFVSGNWEVTYL